MKLLPVIKLLSFTAVTVFSFSCAGDDTKSGPPLPDTLVDIVEPAVIDTPVIASMGDSLVLTKADSVTRTDSALWMKPRLTSDTVRNLPKKEKAEMEKALKFMKRKLSK